MQIYRDGPINPPGFFIDHLVAATLREAMFANPQLDLGLLKIISLNVRNELPLSVDEAIWKPLFGPNFGIRRVIPLTLGGIGKELA